MIRKLFFKLALLLNGFNLNKAKKRLSKYTNQSRQIFFERRDEIVEYHKQHNPLLKRLINGRDIYCFEDLPILTKLDFQSPLKEIISDTFKVNELYVANTSGSSGHPFFYAKNKASHSNTHFIALKLYDSVGISAADKQARFYGIPAQGISRWKEKLKDFLSNRVRFPVFDMSDEHLDVYFNKFARIKFGYIYGYTSAIVLFAKYLQRKNIVLNTVCPTLKCCIVTSEVCLPKDKELIEQSFGVRVINEYGCSETGIIAFENSDNIWEMSTLDCY